MTNTQILRVKGRRSLEAGYTCQIIPMATQPNFTFPFEIHSKTGKKSSIEDCRFDQINNAMSHHWVTKKYA